MADQLLGGLIINEILVDPNSPSNNYDTDGSGTAGDTDEFVELYNASDTAIDISGVGLWDEGMGNWFTFPPGTVLEPGAHALVMPGLQPGGSLPTGEPNDLFFEAGLDGAVLNNCGDNVFVYDPSSDEYIQAMYNGASRSDPTEGDDGYSGFSDSASRNGNGENFGNDTDGQSLQREGDGADTFTSASPTPGTTNVCFAAGTLIMTIDGEKPIENLRPGDLVVTRDRGLRRVLWCRCAPQPLDGLDRDCRPVFINAGSLGANLPREDLIVSPQHRILVGGYDQLETHFEEQAFVPAKALTELPGIRHMMGRSEMTWFHFACDRHEVVRANGCWSESLLLGLMAQQRLTTSERRQLISLLPPAEDPNYMNGPPARPCLTVGKTRHALTVGKKLSLVAA